MPPTSLTPAAVAGLARQAYQKLSSRPGRHAHDPFVQWLLFVNAGMFNPGNLYCFEYAIDHLPTDGPVLEIGSFCGLSTNLISYVLRKGGRPNRLFTCDRWTFEGATPGATIGDSGVSFDDYRALVCDSFLRNVRTFSAANLPHTIELFSDEFFDAWDRRADVTDVFGRPVKLGGRFGFCYIDGNHSYDFAHRDFLHCDANLDPGGFLLFDDSADGSEWDGVRRVVREALATGRYELVIKNPNYLIRKNPV